MATQQQIETGHRGMTSSVGEVKWPPTEASYLRKKGIYPSVIERGQLSAILQDFDAFRFDANTTRYSARIFVARDELFNLDDPTRALLEKHIEGAIPLNGTGIETLADCYMFYIGKNTDDRKQDATQLQNELQLAHDIFTLTPTQTRRRDLSAFTFRILSTQDLQSPNIRAQYIALYAGFGWQQEDVEEILGREGSTFVAGFRGEEIVSTVLVEPATLSIQRYNEHIEFTMAELTEAVTKPEYSGLGLYTQVASTAYEYLANETNVHLVYGESNLRALGVLKAAQSLGRRSSTIELEMLGFPLRVLEQAVPIAASGEVIIPGTYNDLIPTFLPRQDLIDRYGRRTF